MSAEHYYGPSQNPAGLTVLCDVDNTLYADNYNTELISAMKNQGIKEIYLFTNMSLDDVTSKSSNHQAGIPYTTRADIISHVEKLGVNVKGAFTTPYLVLFAGQQAMRAGQQAMRKGSLPSLSELISSMSNSDDKYNAGRTLGEIVGVTPEIAESLQAELTAAYDKFVTLMQSDTVMGQFYQEILAPNYIKAENSSELISHDPEFKATKIVFSLLDHYYHHDINRMSEQLGYEEAKSLMAHIAQAESAAKGFPITNYLMFDDADIIVNDIVKAAQNDITATAVHIRMMRGKNTPASACVTSDEINAGISKAYQDMGLQVYTQLNQSIHNKLQEVNQKQAEQNPASRIVRRGLVNRRKLRDETLQSLLDNVKLNANNPSRIARILQEAATDPVLSRPVWRDLINDLQRCASELTTLSGSLQQANQRILTNNQAVLSIYQSPDLDNTDLSTSNSSPSLHEPQSSLAASSTKPVSRVSALAHHYQNLIDIKHSEQQKTKSPLKEEVAQAKKPIIPKKHKPT